MQEKWNNFVYILSEAKKKGVNEDTYHEKIENQLQFLGWQPYKGDICHKQNIPIGNSNHIQPDILVKKEGEDQFVIEVKRPVHSQSERERMQLQSYMRQLKMAVGIYIGEHIEVFYDMPNCKDAVSVLKIPLELNNKLGMTFVEKFSKENSNKDSIVAFCEEHVKEMQRQSDLNKIKESLITDAQMHITESLKPYLLEKYGDTFSEEDIKGMLAKLFFIAKDKGTDTTEISVVTQPTNDTNASKKRKAKKIGTIVDTSSNTTKRQMVSSIETRDGVIKCFIKRNSNAQGLFNLIDHSLTVLKGSKVSPRHVDKISDSDRIKRDKQLIEYTVEVNGEKIVKEDVVFETPSGASRFCVGGASNGWIEWKDEKNNELKVYRKK